MNDPISVKIENVFSYFFAKQHIDVHMQSYNCMAETDLYLRLVLTLNFRGYTHSWFLPGAVHLSTHVSEDREPALSIAAPQ